ncbi:MAG TPA: ATP-binding cassette domain-containing protein [Planctomycetota bacterium]|nr:ATP-binding cassette domain-containing protein [Planctomycetota bacterium]
MAPALDIDHLQIYRGQRTAILGYSGSGKSTLLNLLGLLDTPDDLRGTGGEIEFARDAGPALLYSRLLSDVARRGLAPRRFLDRLRARRELNALRREAFGFVFQAGHLLDHFDAQENVTLALALRGASREEQAARARSLFRSVFIDDDEAALEARLATRPRELSGGEFQRLAVLRAVAHEPSVVFADEPTGSLDPFTGERVMKLLREWCQPGLDRTLLLVTHKFDEAFRFCDRFIILRDGRVIGSVYSAAWSGPREPGSPSIASAADLFSLYGGA